MEIATSERERERANLQQAAEFLAEPDVKLVVRLFGRDRVVVADGLSVLLLLLAEELDSSANRCRLGRPLGRLKLYTHCARLDKHLSHTPPSLLLLRMHRSFCL